ncbi:MAG: phosphomannomutase/phosphoglucomutase [Acidimicrobiales bacterium]
MAPISSTSRFAPVFKAYDVRGTVPEQLDTAMFYAMGVGAARYARESEGAEAFVIARDMRASGVAFSKALAAGLISEGMDVVDAGLCSTDLLYFASGHLDRPGAMLTASHNPANYNGVKFCLSRAKPVGEESGLAAIRKEAELALGSAPPGGGVAGVEDAAGYRSIDLLPDFARHVHSFVDVTALRPLKVVADTANGMGGLVAPKVFAGLPFGLEVLFGELDGTFPNHPADPIQPENLVDLRRRVLDSGADVGLAFDGDADRVFLVDDQAEPVSGSLTTAMVAAAMLGKSPGATILYNLICSKAVPEVIAERGGTAVRTRVGHSFVKAVMADTGAVFGGEHSGHYYFADNWRADSGIIAALVVLEMMSKEAQPLSQLRKPFERYADSGEINTKVNQPRQVIAAIEQEYAGAARSTDHLDGLTVDFGGWWFNLRPSNTEPLLRLNLEADSSEECAAHVDEVFGRVRALGGVDGPTKGNTDDNGS